MLQHSGSGDEENAFERGPLCNGKTQSKARRKLTCLTYDDNAVSLSLPPYASRLIGFVFKCTVTHL